MMTAVLYHQHLPGKILLSGEYLVLDGATALGLVSRLGQSITVQRADDTQPGTLEWTALDHQGMPWLWADFILESGHRHGTGDSSNHPEKKRLLHWLQAAEDLARAVKTPGQHTSPDHDAYGLRVTTRLDFPRRWGLGSSSTLLALLAGWKGVDARELYSRVQNGSGYDLEIALQGQSILYQKERRVVRAVEFRPPAGSLLRLVDPGSKQVSSLEVSRYRNLDQERRKNAVPRVSQISEALAECPPIQTMLDLFSEHDILLEKVLGQPCLHALQGHGFPGRLKSLGAWGGDLFLAASDQPQKALEWLDNQSYWTSYPLEDIVLVSNP
ncbi:MAG: hypothetical protein ACKOQP_04195 [Bacteroidota bacterium]